jgi:transposase
MPIKMDRNEIRAVYQQGEEAVVALIEMLINRLNYLEAEVERLKGRVSKNSRNSSKPPSSDTVRKTKSLRKKSKLKSGGQHGHPGHTLRMSENIHHTVVHTIKGQCECGAECSKGRLIDIEKRQVHDIPQQINVEVTEHQAELRQCACGKIYTAPFPMGVNAPVQYGKRIRAYIVYLSTYQLLPQKRTTEALRDMFGVEISEGTVNNILRQAHQKLDITENAIKNAIRLSPVMHLDETGMYVNGKRIWEHTCSTQKFTYYFCHTKRGKEAIDSGEMLRNYFGRIIHDGWRSYFDYGCFHALCNAHHLRELVFVYERLQQKWADTLIKLLCRIKKTVDLAKEAGRTNLAPATLNRYHTRYKNLIAAGYRKNPASSAIRKPGQRGRIKQSSTRNLLDRLKTYESDVLAFMYDFNVPFDNNLAERDLRMSKVKQKISGCFRSTAGAEVFCRIRGYISTCRKHGLDVLSYLSKSFSSDGQTCLLPIKT